MASSYSGRRKSNIGELTAAEFLALEYKLLAEGKIIPSIESPSGSVRTDAAVRMQQIKAEIAAMTNILKVAKKSEPYDYKVST
jgi:hypothetical protein